MRRGRLAPKEGTVKVDAHGLPERPRRDVDELLPMRDAGVGAEDVEAAQPLDCLRYQPRTLFWFADIRADERGAPAERLDLRDPLPALLCVSDVVDRDISTALRERECDPAADRALAGRACDQRNLSGQLAQITTRSSPPTTRTS
jgi:hypothetical protein